MIRTLIIHHGTLHGGAPLSLLYTAEGLRENGYEVNIGLVKYQKDIIDFYVSNGFKTLDCSFILPYFYLSASTQPWNKLHTYNNLRKQIFTWNKRSAKFQSFLDEYRYDIVHLNSVVLLNSAWTLLKINKPFVWHIREYSPKTTGFRMAFIKRLMNKCNGLIFLSKAERYSWIQKNNHGMIVSNFIDFDIFNKKLFKQDSKSSSVFRILYVGGFKGYKGYRVLLSAVETLIVKYKIECLMPGTLGGANEKKGVELINNKGLSNYCKLMPFLTDIRDLYSKVDLLVFPATVPHFARPIIEAAAFEKPSIATNIEPISELVINNDTGSLFELGDEKDLASKIEYLILNRNELERLGKNANTFAYENFEKSKQINKIVSLYKKVLS